MPQKPNFPSDKDLRKKAGTGEMTVREAGHLGGEIGGPKVRDLIEKGEQKGHKNA